MCLNVKSYTLDGYNFQNGFYKNISKSALKNKSLKKKFEIREWRGKFCGCIYHCSLWGDLNRLIHPKIKKNRIKGIIVNVLFTMLYVCKITCTRSILLINIKLKVVGL